VQPEEPIDDRIRRAFSGGRGYLNTASVGLPPRVALRALAEHLEIWERGGALLPAFDPDVDRARAAYARLVNVDLGWVAIVSQVSVASGLVAGSLPDGARVLAAREDFTSLLFPFLADRRLDVRLVPLEELIDHIDHRVDLVAVSAVQSADGRVIDADRLAEAARSARARTYVDVTQAAGWLPLALDRFDVTACAAYKWLCCPRGAGFITTNPDDDWLTPRYPGWYSGDDPWQTLYGPPLRLAADARRFNVSPPWQAMAAAAPTLEFLADLDRRRVRDHSVGLANRLRESLGMPPSNSAMVSLDTPHAEALPEAGVMASVRAGRARLSFYLYNSAEDADRAAEILRRGPRGADGPM
jgi:selenocysteine lyase/cysteine desulfurase